MHKGMEGMRHKEAEMKVLGFSQENFNKLKGFCAVENKSFCFICRFCEITVQKVSGKYTELCWGEIVFSSRNFIISRVSSGIAECV